MRHPQPNIKRGFVHKLFLTLGGLLLIYLIILAASEISNNIKENKFIGKNNKPPSLISFEGRGQRALVPDEIKISFEMSAGGAGFSEAYKKLADKINAAKKGFVQEGVLPDDFTVITFGESTLIDENGAESLLFKPRISVNVKDIDSADNIFKIASIFADAGISPEFQFIASDRQKKRKVKEAREDAFAEIAEKIAYYKNNFGLRIIRASSINEFINNYDLYTREHFDGPGTLQESNFPNELIVSVSVSYEIE